VLRPPGGVPLLPRPRVGPRHGAGDAKEMLCMHCQTLQPIGQHCANTACTQPLMAKYYCSICKMLDDSRYVAVTSLFTLLLPFLEVSVWTGFPHAPPFFSF